MGLLWWVAASLCLVFSLGVVNEYKAQKIRVIEKIPVTDWVEYFAIEPSKKVFMIGETVFFKSFSNFKKSYPTEWEDILFCEIPGGNRFVYYSVYKSSNVSPAVFDNSDRGEVWRYGGDVPNYETRCKLRSVTIMTDTDSGVTKPHPVVESSVFRISASADGN